MAGTVVVTGGLTGGHVMPCITLALALQGRRHRVLYVGAEEGLEATMCQRYGVEFAGFRYRRHNGCVRRRLALAGAFRVAVRTFRTYRPDVVFSKGSAVSIPVVFAAKVLGIPVILHESDALPGSETRLLARSCDRLCLGFEQAANHLDWPSTVTGNLPRPNFDGGDRRQCLREYGIHGAKPLLFITGGSQGAESLNRLVFPLVDQLASRYFVIHQCGVGKLDENVCSRDYVQVGFIHDAIRDIYAAADVVVSRAGATAITEISRYRVPALYVPYPWAEGDHQAYNASVVEARGGCAVVSQRGLSPQRLLGEINDMMARRLEYRACYGTWRESDALPRLLDIVEQYASS